MWLVVVFLQRNSGALSKEFFYSSSLDGCKRLPYYNDGAYCLLRSFHGLSIFQYILHGSLPVETPVEFPGLHILEGFFDVLFNVGVYEDGCVLWECMKLAEYCVCLSK